MMMERHEGEGKDKCMIDLASKTKTKEENII
jgi:hypothetical protein